MGVDLYRRMRSNYKCRQFAHFYGGRLAIFTNPFPNLPHTEMQEIMDLLTMKYLARTMTPEETVLHFCDEADTHIFAVANIDLSISYLPLNSPWAYKIAADREDAERAHGPG